VTLVAALISADEREMRYVNAGHPPMAVWGRTGAVRWLESTGPLVSPALTGSTWNAPVVSLDAGDHVLLYTDGAWDTLADDDGRAEARLQAAIADAPEGGAALLDGDSRRRLSATARPAAAGRHHADDRDRAARRNERQAESRAGICEKGGQALWTVPLLYKSPRAADETGFTLRLWLHFAPTPSQSFVSQSRVTPPC
jgi:hypothetical protein